MQAGTLPTAQCSSELKYNLGVAITLTSNALIDLSTFTLDFKGYTQHNGTNGVLGPTGFCQSRFFSRNTQSLIETLENKIGGQTRQLINNCVIF
jgi:hypothetical protein